MREIKFRAFDTELNKMFIIPEMPFEENFDKDFIKKYNITIGTDLMTLVMNIGYIYKTLMQYTGLKDKNGVEIYEGDILIIELDWGYGLSKIYTEVYFDKGMFKAKAINSHEDTPLIEMPYFEIIGSIYENKELLNN